jgi:DNA-directed RNA polymerase specialized sigma24 family protein
MDLLPVLLENHRAFLGYLERRVGDRALAEDILQDAFIKVMDRPDQVLPHDNRAPTAPAGHTVLHSLNLNERELRQLEAFLRSLTSVE